MILTKKAFAWIKKQWNGLHPDNRPYLCVLLALLSLLLVTLSFHFPLLGLALLAAPCVWVYLDINYTQQQRNRNELSLQRAIVGVSECLYSLVSSLHSILGVESPPNMASMVDAANPLFYPDNTIPMVRVILQKLPNRANNGYDIKDMLNRGIASMSKIGRVPIVSCNTKARSQPAYTIAYVTEDNFYICLDIALLDYPGTIAYLQKYPDKPSSHKNPPAPPTTHEFN